MKLKHRFQRLAAALACLMLCVCFVPQAATASNAGGYRYKQLTEAQMNGKYSLSLEFSAENTKFSGVDFRIYKVAEMDREARFTGLSEGFNNETYAKILRMDQINDPSYANSNWLKLANTLSSYVQAKDTAVEPVQTAKTDKDGMVRFSELGVGLYLVVGAPYRVELGYGYRTYAPTSFLVTAPGWDAESESWTDVDRDLNAQSKVTISTYYYPAPTVERRVTKVWDDEDHEDARPESVSVQLLRDGAVYDTVELNAGNNWRHSWSGLSATSTWTLVELIDEDGDYAPLITQEGMTFVVTNTYQEEIDPENPPLASFPPEASEDPGESETPAPGESAAPETPAPVGPSQPVEPTKPAETEVPGPETSDAPQETDAPNPEESEEPIDIGEDDPPLADLPQTGVLWWPVPVMGAGGTVMLLMGLVRRRSGSGR